MTMAFRRRDGNSVPVTFTSDVSEGDLAYAEGWLGFVPRDRQSGEGADLNIEDAEFDIILPTSLNLSKGDNVFVDVTDLTGHIPDSTAYATSTGSNRRRLGRCTTDQDGTSGQVRILSALREQDLGG